MEMLNPVFFLFNSGLGCLVLSWLLVEKIELAAHIKLVFRIFSLMLEPCFPRKWCLFSSCHTADMREERREAISTGTFTEK